jgi:transposase InsO family protein
MSRKRFSPEQIITMLREAEVLLSQGAQVAEVWRKLEVSEQTYYRWRKEYGGMRVDQAKRLKELEQENARLKKRVERIWRQEGLKVPQKQPKRGRLWLNDGSCIRLRPMKKDHVWSYDLVIDRTSDGRPLRILVIIDEFTRECLSMYVSRRITSPDVLDQLYGLFLSRGTPEHIRSDNGVEFTANAVRGWLKDLGVTALYIEPGSPWENGYVESYIGKFRDKLLNGEILDTLMEAKVLVEGWRRSWRGICRSSGSTSVRLRCADSGRCWPIIMPRHGIPRSSRVPSPSLIRR